MKIKKHISKEEAEKILKDFLDVPKPKKKISSAKELKKIIYEQYDEKLKRSLNIK